MPAEIWARFEEWRKNGTLTDDMQHWVRDYMTQNASGDHVKKNLPDPNDDNVLSETESRKLFVAFQNAFAGMAAELDSFKDKDPQSANFTNTYFGNGKLFQTSPATQECKDGIAKILQLLNQHRNLQDYIVENTKKSDGKPVFESVDKLQEFLKKCQNRQYDTDNSIQKKIQQVAKTLSDVVGWYSSIDQNSPEYQAIYAIKTDLDNVTDKGAFATDPRSIPSDKLKNFRKIYAKQDKSGLLQTLYFNRTIRERFAKYDNGVITGPIDKAEESVNWQDKSKENYVDPKVSDVLTPLQQLEKWATDTYADTLKKYEELRGAPIFRRQEAKDIFAAIDKNKIKPKDGLKAILDKKSDIEKKLNNPVARQHFKWFTETMEPIAAKMPKSVEGAWKNATQMKAVIEQIILRATDPNNSDPHAIEKAETAMEIMTAMKYGMLTSKVMDAMRNTDFNVFSDKDLSWNKNEGIQFVTKAFDKSIKAAFLGIGYGVTIARNKIIMSGMKFKNKDNQNKSALAQRFNDEDTTKQQALRNQNTADQNTISKLQREINNLTRSTTNNITQRQANYQQILNSSTAIKNANQADYDRYNDAIAFINNNPANPGEFSAKHTKRRDLKSEIQQLKNQLTAYQGLNDAVSIAEALAINQQITEKQKEVNQLTQEMQNLAQGIIKHRKAEADVNNLKQAHDAYEQADKNYTRTKQQQDELPSKTARITEATQEINELNRAINERNNALANWPQKNTNNVLYLENYWNWLQTGQTKTFRFSAKAAQKRFNKDNLNDALLQNYISQHGLAA